MISILKYIKDKIPYFIVSWQNYRFRIIIIKHRYLCIKKNLKIGHQWFVLICMRKYFPLHLEIDFSSYYYNLLYIQYSVFSKINNIYLVIVSFTHSVTFQLHIKNIYYGLFFSTLIPCSNYKTVQCSPWPVCFPIPRNKLQK